MARIVLAALAILSVLVLFRSATAAPSCATVDRQLSSCASYMEAAVASPSSACCAGFKAVVGRLIKGRDDKIAVCNCIKGEVAKLRHVVPSHIYDLPRKCGITNAYAMNLIPMEKDYDCSKIIA